MKITIQNDAVVAVIDSMGAELVSLKFHGTERLWQNDNGSWSGHAPVLFPMCGNCSAVFDGWKSPMQRHGFARRTEFKLQSQGSDFVTFTLTDNEETRKVYPFAFRLTVGYFLRGNGVEIVYETENKQESPIPFGWGGHVSHALFSSLNECALKFSDTEQFTALLHDENGLLTGETADMGRGKTLALSENLLANARTVIFGGIRSRTVTLQSGGAPLAQLSFEGFENLLLWHPVGSKMLCIEPWTNLPDSQETQGMELAEKRGIINLPAGKTARAVQKFTYFEV